MISLSFTQIAAEIILTLKVLIMLILALNDGLTKREDLFVITKIADIHHDRASESQEHQLKLLGLEYSGINSRS